MAAINFWTSLIGHALLAVNFILCLRLREVLPRHFRWLLLLLGSSLVIRVVALILWFQSRNNLPLLHLYTLLEFTFLSLLYRGLLQSLRLKYFDGFVLLTIAFILLNSIFIQPLTSFNTYAKTLTQLAYIGYALLYFFRLPKGRNLLPDLVNSAILIYYSASLFIFMFTNVLTNLKDLLPYYDYLWIVNIVLDWIFQAMILYGLWTTGWRQTKSLP